MNRPCNCNRCETNKPWDSTQCRLCWLYHNDSRYHKLWDEPTKPIIKPPTLNFGPGTELKTILAALGLDVQAGCGCADRVELMNRWGVDGCLNHFEDIRGWLRDAAKKLHWTEILAASLHAAASLAFKLDPIDPFGSLVSLAIDRAEKRTIETYPADK